MVFITFYMILLNFQTWYGACKFKSSKVDFDTVFMGYVM